MSPTMSTLAPVAAVLAAFLVSVALLPLVGRLAVHHRLLDAPDANRRMHDRPIPRLGGVAVFAAVLVVGGVGMLLEDRTHAVRLLPFVTAMIAGASILFVVGLADDIRGVGPGAKLLVQLVAALVVYRAGFRIDALTIFSETPIVLGVLSLPVTLLWIVGLTNAFNLVDGADGLAAGVAAIALVATAAAAAAVHDTTVLWASLTLLGAMLGFLRFNWPPARIFLGDSGSLVVGFLLAVLTVKGATTRTGTLSALAPIFALSYPLLDTGISMLRRWLRGEPLSRADGRHIHHQLRALGIGPRQSLLMICTLSAVVASLGLSVTFAPPQFTVAIACAASVMLALIFVYGLRWLQYHEFLEAGASVTSAALRARTVIRDKIRARDVALLLQRAPTFEALCGILERSAASFRFVHVELQGRSATRQFVEPIPVQVHGARTWKLEFPVTRPDATTHPIVLSIWSAVDGSGTPAGAERVAQILAPAVAEWFVAHANQQDIRALLQARFPGVYTPSRPFAAVTSNFSLADLNASRRPARADVDRMLSGD